MEDFDGQKAYAFYSSFAISPKVTDPELDGYKLQVTGFKDGGAGENSLNFLRETSGLYSLVQSSAKFPHSVLFDSW